MEQLEERLMNLLSEAKTKVKMSPLFSDSLY